MIYSFDEYELDLRRYELRRRGQPIKLEPQVFNLLAYLIQHRDRVVTKQALLDALWPGRFVGEATLTSRMMTARRAVGDRGREQRVIQTLHGRGYRFIAEVAERHEVTSAGPGQAPAPQHPAPAVRPVLPASQLMEDGPPGAPVPPSIHGLASVVSGVGQDRRIIGRETELAQLHRWLQRTLDGTRQIVFVTGEAGLGKTTVVDTFIEEARGHGVRSIGRGQCIEHYGAGEAYMPVLEALGQLCREPDGQIFTEVLARRAPTWLVQLPWLVSDAAYEVLQRRVQGATRERMLREMAEAIEVLTAERPLVLVIDDLHWSDYATLDLVALLAQRREPARFLLLGTYRPEAVRAAGGHPLLGIMQALQLHQHCQELSLSALSAVEVEAYLVARLMNGSLAAALGPTLHRRTEGNPLFMVNLLEHWMAHGWLSQQHGQWTLRTGWEAIAREIPATLRELVTQRQARLGPTEQRLLEVASVAGLEFSAASIAAGLAAEVVETEARCEELMRRGEFLQACGVDTWPDGTVATRYRFRHALYQDVVYERIPAARQAQIHQRIGGREAAGYGERCSEIAARLAMHFERGHDLPRAVRYHHQAAQQAMQRSGYQEAIVHLTRGLELLQLPESPERAQQELALQIALGSALRATKAYGAPDVEHTYLRARELCRQLGEPPEVFPVLYGLYELYEYLGVFQRSGELGEEILRLAHRRHDATFLLGAYDAMACTAFHLGAFAQVVDHTERGLTLYDPQHHRVLASLYGKDLGVTCRYWSAMALWFLGYPDQALRRIDAALTQAQELAHPYTVAAVHNRAAFLGQFLQQPHAARQWAEIAAAVSAEHGFPRHAALGSVLKGWAMAMQGQGEEGIAQIRQGMVAYRELGMAMEDAYFLTLLAEAHASVGRIEEERATLAKALVALPSGRDFFYKAELYRLQGELLWQQSVSDAGQVEACFQQALAIARRQQAKSLELRAAVSLSRLWRRQGKPDEARQLLAEIYGWFTEGFDTRDLQEAHALLQELESGPPEKP